MEFIVWVETRLAGKTLAVEEVAQFDRCASGIASEEIGLTLQQGKDVLKQVQRNIVQTQIRVQSAASSQGQRYGFCGISPGKCGPSQSFNSESNSMCMSNGKYNSSNCR
jgi:hypothetical protein